MASNKAGAIGTKHLPLSSRNKALHLVSETLVYTQNRTLQTLCKTFKMKQHNPNTVFTDNLGAIALTKGQPYLHQRSKHIDIRFHIVREQTTIVYQHIRGAENPANVMAKSLPKTNHRIALEPLAIESHAWGGVLRNNHAILSLITFITITWQCTN